jgi:CPA1 family monovalent cation:H+ antiporter
MSRSCHASLFGALISPTDPIAVMGISSLPEPKELELVITGEIAVRDGIAIVVFAILIDVMAGRASPDGRGGALCSCTRPAADCCTASCWAG